MGWTLRLAIVACVFGFTFLFTLYQTTLDPVHSALVAAGLAVLTLGLGVVRENEKREAAILITFGLLVAALSIAHAKMAESTSVEASDKPGDPVPGGIETTLLAPTPSASESPQANPATPLEGSREAVPSDASLDLILSPSYAARGAPQVSAYVTPGSGGAQRLVIDVADLGLSSISLDLEDPYGGTVLGASMGSVDTMVFTYDLFPPYSGLYQVSVTNKENGGVGLATVELASATAASIVRPYEGGIPPRLEVWAEGNACQPAGARIMVKTYGAPEGANLHGSLPDGQFVDSGVSGDSVGTSYHAFGLRASSCTGSAISGIDFTLEDAGGGALAAASVAVQN